MADEPDADKLRQMAEHRGLKLVRSRRRKAGVGDYGMFGLTDAAGKPLLGMGKDGLTASAQDIEAYLRAGALGTWQKSANATPDKPAPRSKRQSLPDAQAAPVKAKPPVKPAPPHKRRIQSPPDRKVAPPPEPPLVIRAAAPADADFLARLLGGLHGIAIDHETTRRNMARLRQAGGGMLLAERGVTVGCCAWAVVQTVHRGPIGRITAIFVDQNERRKGIATQLFAAAEQALVGKGCTTVEVMSDIQIDNAHNFFRMLKFAQASYRFTRKLPGSI